MTHPPRDPFLEAHTANLGSTVRLDLRAACGRGRHACALATLGVLLGAAMTAHAADACSAKSTRHATSVVELYTSEGCNSCPPADRWLSKLKTDPQTIALAFHVDYWDRLGWKDRFASPAYTQRQAEQQTVNGARFSYTPQVVVDGADRKDWSSIATPLPARSATPPVDLELIRDGRRVTATIAPAPNAPKRLAAYWAVTEQDHVTAVKAGENEGVTLKHDNVVRDYCTVAAWATRGDTPQTLTYELPPATDASHRRDLNLVVVDAGTGRPLQAVRLGC